MQLLFAVLALGLGSADAVCTPIYPQCTCKTTSLSCTTFDAIYANLTARLDALRPGTTVRQNPWTAIPMGRTAGGIVRLAFHDAGEFYVNDPTGPRPDGCINTADPKNGGLSNTIAMLDQWWLPFCSQISRADFWYLAAKVVLETSSPYFGNRTILNVPNFYNAPSAVGYWHLPFYIGREDRTSCSYTDTDNRLPDAMRNTSELTRLLISNFGLDYREGAALMGSHTLGGLSSQNSGFNGTWKSRADLLTTEYFWTMKNEVFVRANIPSSSLIQWNWAFTIGTTPLNATFLSADLQLLYNVDPTQPASLRNAYGAYNLGHDISPLSWTQWALAFAECSRTAVPPGHNCDTGTMDEPGASRWLSVYARAFNKMSQVGYAAGDLSCVTCPSPNCGGRCTTSIMCEGPEYGYYTPTSTGTRTRTATTTLQPGAQTRTKTHQTRTRTHTMTHQTHTRTKTKRTHTRTKTKRTHTRTKTKRTHTRTKTKRTHTRTKSHQTRTKTHHTPSNTGVPTNLPETRTRAPDAGQSAWVSPNWWALAVLVAVAIASSAFGQ